MKGRFNMRDTVKFPVLPDLSVIDFSCTSDVRTLVNERRQHMFGVRGDGYIDEYMEAIADLFAGRHPDYQAMDTAYHDITHTMQATLCLVELLHHRHFSDAQPTVGAEDFKRAVIAILFHDIGYLKMVGDSDGSGAKYTHVHEKRSCALARKYLGQRGWSDDDIVFVENLISATGPLADLTKIEFRSEVERLLGQVVCTADYIGQMSDPDYPDKLEVLYSEFEESYRYQKIPRSKWPFTSYESLLRSTPDFWGKFVQYKMTVECGGVWDYLEHPVTGQNPHIESIAGNLATIRQRISCLENPGQRSVRRIAAAQS
jgi:hypothetical protein